jgi:glycine/D-amino acid oxidase-like deaminating enzyme
MASSELRLQRNIKRDTAFEITINADPCTAYPGENLATVLLAAGHSTFRRSPMAGKILAELIEGGESPVSLAPFQPDRISDAGANRN